MTVEEGLATLGRYELITQIGQGGMAEVKLALQRGPGGFEKLVVIKLIHDNLATQKTFVDMLMDEARVAALVKHPNVVDIYDLGHAEGRFYIAMEYLEGEPLLGLLRAGRDGKRLDCLSTARLIADTAEGLDAAHELRNLAGDPIELVHHDVSLGNIVVLYNGQVKLVDFGVAKATQRSAPKGKVHGKFGYMAPEKLRASAGDRRSDIWSLGVVLWEALTLRRLFKGGNDKDTMKLVLDYQIPRPSIINNDVPPDLDPIVMRALERDPNRRYARAKELAQDLEEVLRVNGYGGRNDLIAKYMQTTFASHIEARKKLLQEVSTKGRASADVLEAAFAEPLVPVPQVIHTPQGPRQIRPSGEFSISFKRGTQETPVTGAHSVATELPTPSLGEGTPDRTTSAEMAAQEILAKRLEHTSEEMMAEGTPHSGVRELPRKQRITNTPQFAEATPIIPELDLAMAMHRADTVQEDPPEAELGETIVYRASHAAVLMDAVTMPDAPVQRTSGVYAVPPEAIANADSVSLGDMLDGDAKKDIELSRVESLGRSISDILDRWPESPGAATEPMPAYNGTKAMLRKKQPSTYPPPTHTPAHATPVAHAPRKKAHSTNSPLLVPPSPDEIKRKSALIQVPVAVRVERKIWPYVFAVVILATAFTIAALLILSA